MHVLYLSAPGGGLETNVRILGRALREAGHRVSILYLHGAGERVGGGQDPDGFQVYRARVGDMHYWLHRALLGYSSLPLAVRALETASAVARRVNEIHRQDPLDLVELPEIGFAWQRLSVPYVMRLHSAAWTWRVMSGELPLRADGLEKRFEGIALRQAAGVSSPSRVLAEIVRAECGFGGRVELIPYPVDTARFTPASCARTGKRVLFVGRVEWRKGADVLLCAIPHILKKHPDAEFVFAGRLSAELEALAAEAPPQVKFLGVVPHDRLAAGYQSAAVVVCPSRWDNSPNVIYEAMASGVPVVATRVGGISELVEDGVTGRLVQRGDAAALAAAVAELLDDPDGRVLMGKRARECAVREYAVEIVLEKTLAFYERAAVK